MKAHRSTTEIGRCDLVIVAVKTAFNPELPPLIAPLLGKRTIILTLQNGLGNEEFFAEHFGAKRIPGGLCYICRPLEIEAIWGEPLRRGQAKGVKAPQLEKLYGELVALDQAQQK